MTTKTAGGIITGRLALTLEAQEALEVGDPVIITGPYECEKANGGNAFAGIVTDANKKRVGGTYPNPEVPGDVTVEAPGKFVYTVPAEVAIDPGERVHLSATGGFVPAGDAAAVGAAVGLALTGAAIGADLDVLFY